MNRKSVVFFIAVIALIILVGGLLLQQPQAPQLSYTTIKGERITSDDLKGKVVLVNFWATDCPGCIREMPALIATHHKYRERGFETMAVAMSYDPPNYVVNFSEKNALPFKVVLDIKGDIARAFGGVTLTPTSFLLDKQGKIARKFLGEPDFGELHQLIERKMKES